MIVKIARQAMCQAVVVAIDFVPPVSKARHIPTRGDTVRTQHTSIEGIIRQMVDIGGRP